MKEDFFSRYMEVICARLRDFNPSDVRSATLLIEAKAKKHGKLIIAGNGGSAAIASHLCVDFTKTARVRAVNFNEANLITCFANDYGYEHWVAKALEYYADPNDLVLLISSGGRSPNMLNAATKAREMDLDIITATGFSPDNPLRKMGNINFWVDSSTYNVVEMVHHTWLVAIADCLAETADARAPVAR